MPPSLAVDEHANCPSTPRTVDSAAMDGAVTNVADQNLNVDNHKKKPIDLDTQCTPIQELPDKDNRRVSQTTWYIRMERVKGSMYTDR